MRGRAGRGARNGVRRPVGRGRQDTGGVLDASWRGLEEPLGLFTGPQPPLDLITLLDRKAQPVEPGGALVMRDAQQLIEDVQQIRAGLARFAHEVTPYPRRSHNYRNPES